MKKNAFTLTELLAVIVILTVMGILIIPLVESSINNGKNDLYKSELDSLKASFKRFSMKELNKTLLNTNDDIYVSLYQLKIAGAVSMDLKDPRNEEYLPNDILFRVEKLNKSYNYEVLENRGTKTNSVFKGVLDVKDYVVYACPTTTDQINSIANDIVSPAGVMNITYYDSSLLNQITIAQALSTSKFRIVYSYKVNQADTVPAAYAIKNVIRSGCE